MHSLRSALIFLFSMTLMACGGDDDSPATVDSGGTDSGSMSADSGGADTGTPGVDGGTVGRDGGEAKTDGGPAPTDDCNGDECVACIVGKPPETEADCTCLACPFFPASRTGCEARQMTYNRICGAWRLRNPCPDVLCTEPPVVSCIDNTCQPGPATM